MTAAIVIMLLVAVGFVNSYLNGQIAQNEFNSMKQVMQTVGLQTDDVAWIPGRTQTLTYTTKYGQVTFRSPALSYSFYFDGSLVANFSVGIILFDMPTRNYAIANNYYQNVYPSSNSFLQANTSAPVCSIFVTEQTPMPDGSFIRIVVAPIIRQINAVIANTTYVRFYLPILNQGVILQPSQSVTLTGINVSYLTKSNVNNVTITIGFPNSVGMGLTSSFFNFSATSQTVILGSSSSNIVEIYGGNVTVSQGFSP